MYFNSKSLAPIMLLTTFTCTYSRAYVVGTVDGRGYEGLFVTLVAVSLDFKSAYWGLFFFVELDRFAELKYNSLRHLDLQILAIFFVHDNDNAAIDLLYPCAWARGNDRH